MDFGDWIGLAGQLSVLTVLTIALAGALFGAAIARWAAFPIWLGVLLGVLAPILGPLIAALVSVQSRSRDGSTRVRGAGGSDKTPTSSRRLDAIWIAVAILAAIVALIVPWFELRFGAGSPRLSVYAWGRAIDVLLIVSIVLLTAALMVVILARHRPAAVVLVIPVVAFWAWAAAGLAFLSAPLERLLSAVGGLEYTVGAALAFLGIDTSTATIVLPEGIDPAVLGLESSTIDVASLDLAAMIPTLGLRPAVGWYIMLGAAIVLLVWVVVALVSRHRTSSVAATRSESPTWTAPAPTWDSSPTRPTSATPWPGDDE